MSKGVFTTIIGLTLLLVLASSCRVKKNLPYVKPKNHSNNFLEKKMLENEFQFETFSFKAAVKAKVKGKTNSVKASIRIKKDSIIWTTLTYLKKPVFILLVTNDSLKFINKLDKEYFLGEIDYINQAFGADISLLMLQDLIIGNAISYDKDNKYKSKIDSTFYHLFSDIKKKIKLANGQKKKIEYHNDHWLNSENYKLVEQKIESVLDSSYLQVEYSDFEIINEQKFPGNSNINVVSPKDSVNINLKNSKFQLNEPLTFPFNYKSSYTKIE